MQSGTTGINTMRVYNPIKQAQDQDPKGQFVKLWLPHMRQVPVTWLFEPWKMPDNVKTQAGIFEEITQPLVDLTVATRESKNRLYARRQNPEVKAGKMSVVDKHASRKKMQPRKKTSVPKNSNKHQLSFDF